MVARSYEVNDLFFVIAYFILPILATYGLWTLPKWHWTDAINTWAKENWAWSLAGMIGAILIVWIAVEVSLIGSPDGFPRFLQVMMTLMGVVIISLAMLPRVRTYARLKD